MGGGVQESRRRDENHPYTGIEAAFLPKHQKKLDVKFGRVAKLLDRKEEKEAHVVLTVQRHLQKAEITVRYSATRWLRFQAEPDAFERGHRRPSKRCRSKF